MLHVWWKFINNFVIFTGCLIQIELGGVVHCYFLHGENITSQLELFTKGSQEISEWKLSLPNCESSVGVLTYILIAIMQICFDQTSWQQFSQHGCIKLTDQNYRFLIKFTTRLLGHFQSFKTLTINELQLGVNRFKFGVGFKWDIFASD